jgi:hypothetical protein
MVPLSLMLLLLVSYKYPDLSSYHREWRLHELAPPFRSISVYHKLRFFNDDYDSSETLDSVHASPRVYNRKGKLLSASRFDTALIYVRDPKEGAVSAMDGEPSFSLFCSMPYSCSVAQAYKWDVFVSCSCFIT